MTVTLSNPNEMRREMARRTSNRERVLEALRAAGPAGCLNVFLMRPDVGGSRAGGRVQDLRDAGFVIDCDRIQDGTYRYTLRSEPGQAPTPGSAGYLASLPVVASINPRGQVTPVTTDDRPRAGHLF